MKVEWKFSEKFNEKFNEKFDEKFNESLQFYPRSDRSHHVVSLIKDHGLGLRGLWNFVKRGGKSFNDLCKAELGITEEALNWLPSLTVTNKDPG